MKATFLSLLGDELGEVRGQLEKLKVREEAIRADAAEQLRGISEERTRLEARARHIQALLALDGQADAEALPQDEQGGRHSDAWLEINDMPLADATHRVLVELGRELHYKELARELQMRGVSIPGKDPAINLVAHIHDDARMIRPRRGVYALKEWYPNLTASVGTRKRRRTRTKKARRRTGAGRVAA